MNSVATESSGQWASTQDTLGSVPQSAATAASQNDSSLSPRIAKADTNPMRSEGQIEKTTTFVPDLTSPTPPSPPLPSTLSRRASPIIEEETYGTQVSIDENKAQSASLPSDTTDASQLPPLVPVRRPSQSQPNDQVQSATTSPPVSQNTFTQGFHSPIPENAAALQGGHQLLSQYSQESHRVLTAQTPQTYPSRTFGDMPTRSSHRTPHEGWNSSRPPSPQSTTPFQRSAPTTPSMYWGTPYRPNQSVVTPQPHSWGPTQSFIPQSAPPQLYTLPNAPTPQASQSFREAIHQQFVQQSAPFQSYGLPRTRTPPTQSMHAGMAEPSIPQTSGSYFGHGPSRQPISTSPYSRPTRTSSFNRYDSQTANPQTSRKANAFVASDPFRISRGNDKVDVPSDGLTFDDIPTAGSAPGPAPTTPQAYSIYAGTPQQFVPRPVSPRFYSLPTNHTPQAHSVHAGTPQQFIPQSASPRFYSTPNAPTPQAGQSIYAGTPQPFPQPITPRFSSNPNAPTPQSQSIHAGPPQPSQMFGSQFDRPFPDSLYPTPRVSRKKGDSFVASDPFRMSRGDDKVDAPSNFDDIPTVESAPEPRFTQGMMMTSPYGGYLPNSAPPPAGAYGESHNSTRRRTYSASNDLQPWYQRPQPGVYSLPATPMPIRQSSWSPVRTPPLPEDAASEHRRPSLPSEPPIRIPQTPFIPRLPSPDDASKQEDPDVAQPKPPTSVSSPPVQTQAPVSPVPSSQHSSIIRPNADAAVIPPALPVDRPSSPSRSQDIPFTLYESQKANQSPYGPYVFHAPYVPYPPLPHLQYPQYPYPGLQIPKESIFSRLTRFFRGSQRTHPLVNPQHFTAIYPQPFTQPYTMIYPLMESEIDWHEVTLKFLLVTFPKQMYLNLLLRLPSLYFSRVARIFEEAEMSLPEIKKMALETASQGLTHEFEIQMAFESSTVPPAYKRLTSTWEYFIDSVMREWKILNIISVLLLTAIMSILQIQSAAEDPLTRYTALFSLICTVISLLFGCMYMIRFGGMRRTYKAAEWALEAQNTKTLIWWNVWILLAMPAIWLTWSIILYIACIMSFVWRSGVTSSTPPGLSDTRLLALRICITIILGIGLLYGILIMTTFRRYGAVMDRAWKQRIDEWIEEKATGNTEPFIHPILDKPSSYPSPWGNYPGLTKPSSSPWGGYPGLSRMYQPPTYNYPVGDSIGKYYRYAHTPAYPPHTYVPSPYASPKGSLHSESSTDTLTRANASTNNLSNRQDRDDMTSAAYIPNPAATPPPLDSREPVANPVEIPPRLIPKTATPQSLLSTIPESPITPFTDPSGENRDNAVGFSSGLENRDGGGGDATGDRQRVRFRLPAGGSDPRKTRS